MPIFTGTLPTVNHRFTARAATVNTSGERGTDGGGAEVWNGLDAGDGGAAEGVAGMGGGTAAAAVAARTGAGVSCTTGLRVSSASVG